MKPQQTAQPQQPAIPPQFPPSPTPTQIPPSPKPKLSLILLIAIIVVLLLGGGCYFLSGKGKLITQPTILPTKAIMQTLTPSPNPILNWKTYRNEELGFLIKYPNKYSPKPRTNGVSFLLPYEDKEVEKIIIEKNFAGGWGCTQTVSSEEIVIDGNKGKLEIHATATPDEDCSKIDPNGSRSSTVVISYKGVAWFFLYQIEKLQETEEIAEFKNILSTFKFLE